MPRTASSIPRGSRPISDRLEDASCPVTESGCWLWLGSLDNCGYGTLRINGRTVKAHRASFMVYRDMIPKGMKVLHSCDIRCCVNPDHLFIGSQRENVHDMMSKGRHRPLRGEENGNSKLTREQADEIRISTESLKSLAERYGIGKSMAGYIKAGKYWK